MMAKFRILIVLFLIGCASNKLEQLKMVSLREVETGMSKELTQKQVELRFGRPDMRHIFDGNSVALIYLGGNPPSTRVSFVFNSESGKLGSIGWFTSGSDPESNLEYVKKLYPNAKFVESTPEWTNPHSAPDEIFYEDAHLGLTIIYQKTPRYVSSIEWDFSEKPEARKPADR